jgi:DNA repair protein RecO (recombination protein O)
MQSKTEGIILRTQRFGEADLIVTYLTPDRGLIKAFAKSPRKTKSRFGSSLEPFTHAHIELFGKEQAMPKIIQSDIINSYHLLREDFKKFLSISKLTEVLLHLVPEGHGGYKLFHLYRNQLDRLAFAQDENSRLFPVISMIHLLAALGYCPGLIHGCGRCGKDSQTFYSKHGTLLCNNCAQNREPCVVLSKATLNLYRHILTWPDSALKRLKPSEQICFELENLLEIHITHLTNKKLKTSEFSCTLTSICL